MILRFRIIRIVVWVVLFLVASNTTLFAQEAADRKIQRSEASVLISAIAETVEQNYNSASVAKELATDLQSNFRDEKYKDLTLQEFANAVGTDLRFKSGDKHLAVVYQPERAKTTGDRQNRTTDRYGQLSNFGHEEFKILPNNIGYLKVGHFSRGEHFEQAKEAVDRSMQWLKGRDAIIIDMRDNPGGFVNLVPYFASYFLEGSGVLQRCYCRSLDQTRTIDMVLDLPEPKNTMTPLFILVNQKTASAAESFAYMLKHRKRATLIGEKTVGVANPTNSFRISKDFVVQVTTWETTDISTDTNWEPGGVVPDVECESATALAKAMALATEAAKTHKSERDTKYIAARNQLQQWLQREHPIETNKLQLIAKLEEFRDLDLLRERHVNWMGYELLDNVKNSHLAETVFKANTRFFPDSPNVYDSYGDALVANGKLHEARRSYERAIELGKNLNSEDIKTFLNNLKNVKERMSSESTKSVKI